MVLYYFFNVRKKSKHNFHSFFYLMFNHCIFFLLYVPNICSCSNIYYYISGLINSAWDVGSICSTLVVAYMGSAGHKPRWVAWGTCLVALSCYMRLIPHWLYGPGEDALAVTEEFGAANSFRQLNTDSTDSSG
jgi:hypothetical protein